MKKFIKRNIVYLVLYFILVGGALLINARFDNIDIEENNTNNIIAINK